MLVGLPALLEAEALPVHLQDMDMVGEAVEEGPGEPFRAKDIGPLVEGQVLATSIKWDTFVKERSGGNGGVVGLPEKVIVPGFPR